MRNVAQRNEAVKLRKGKSRKEEKKRDDGEVIVVSCLPGTRFVISTHEYNFFLSPLKA